MIIDNNGMKRTTNKPAYRKIPWSALRRVAETLEEGAIKYDEKLDEENWKKGDPESARKCFDHAVEHIWKYREGWDDEDHLSHAICNLIFLMWYQEVGVWDPVNGYNTKEELATNDSNEPPPQFTETFFQKLMKNIKDKANSKEVELTLS